MFTRTWSNVSCQELQEDIRTLEIVLKKRTISNELHRNSMNLRTPEKTALVSTTFGTS